MDWFTRLFSGEGFPARWHCGQWTDGLGLLHIISDILVWLAYAVLPAYVYVRRQHTDPEHRAWADWPVIIFFLFCGLGHLWEAVIMWHPFYRFTGLWKLGTAAVSWLAIFKLWPVLREYRTAGQFRAVERRLWHEHARMDLVLAHATDGIYGTDDRGRCVFANAAAARLTGWSIDELVGADLHVLLAHADEHGKPLTHEECPSLRVLKSGEAYSGAGRYTRKDGVSIEVEFSTAPVFGPGGEVAGRLTTFRDVTNARAVRRHLTAELEKLRSQRKDADDHNDASTSGRLDNLIARLEALREPG